WVVAADADRESRRRIPALRHLRSVEVALDSHLSLADAVRLEPVNFRQPYPTIEEPDAGNAFQLPPPTLTVTLPQQRTYTDAAPDRNNLDLRDRADDFKVHYAPS